MQLFADFSTALVLTILTILTIVLCSNIRQLKYNSIYMYALVLRTALSVLCVSFWIKTIFQFW